MTQVVLKVHSKAIASWGNGISTLRNSDDHFKLETEKTAIYFLFLYQPINMNSNIHGVVFGMESFSDSNQGFSNYHLVIPHKR